MTALAAGGCVLGGGPVTTWAVSDTRELRPDSPPSPENEVYSAASGTVRLMAAINETVAFQLAMRTEAPPAGRIDVHVSDLTGPGGSIAAAESVSLFRVHTVRVQEFRSWYPRHTGRSATPVDVLDVAVPWNAPRGGGPISLDDRSTRVAWIDLHVPPSAAPGEYRGRVELVGPGRDAQPLGGMEIELTVVPVAIPSERSLPVICRVDPRDLLRRQLDRTGVDPEALRVVPQEPRHHGAVRLLDGTMRLFHEHRATPALWSSFPKYRLVADNRVEVDWETYDELVSGWFDGDAFDDKVRLAVLPLPVSERYPDAEQNGGFHSPAYARVLSAYLAACRDHFAARGWLDRALVRLVAPAPLTESLVRRIDRAAGILTQSEIGVPMLSHVPAGSLRGLGWHGAPTVEPASVDLWAPPAGWCDPQPLARERNLGKGVWFAPDRPPYSGSLSPAAPPTDVRALAWMAHRYGMLGIWIEHAADAPPAGSFDAGGEPLVYSGDPFGLADRPVASLRLKRLRRGLLDYELLRLLERAGKPLLAQRTARQLVRWGLLDACADNLLDTRDSGWSQDPYAYELARRVVLQELANEFAPTDMGLDQQLDNLVDWGRLMSSTPPARAEARGARLTTTPDGLKAHIEVALSSTHDEPIRGRWRIPDAPVGWRVAAPATVEVAPKRRGTSVIEAMVDALAYDAEGVYPFRVLFDSPQTGSFAAEARLAVAACPFVATPPTIDGDLSDWHPAPNNTAGSFLLCAGEGEPPGSRRPTRATWASFATDQRYLYVAVYCELGPEDRPTWSPDNHVPIDGALPWGQDVVEILLDPSASVRGDGAGLFVLQVKPSGLLVARRGARTDPPMNDSQTWSPAARVAVGVRRDAWTVELALPIEALGDDALRNPVWGCNVTRLDARRGEYSSWSGARGYTYAPQRLGNLIIQMP